jgi:hypothetical protein
MYHLFIAGVTYLNSLWQAHRCGWTIVPSYVDALLEIQTCTSVMEALAAITPGTSAVRDTFETVSERIIRQLSANAKWDTLSRPASPPFNGIPSSNQIDMSGNGNTTDMQHGWASDIFLGTDNLDPIMNIANPFDTFLLHPLGDISGADWGRAFASVVGDASNTDFSSNMGQ